MAQLAGQGQGMNNLTTLIKRLEAATSRLEDIASSATSTDSSATASLAGISPSVPAGGSGTRGIPTAAGSHDVQSAVAAPAPAAPSLPPTVVAMDELMETEVRSFQDASKGVDPLVEEQAAAVGKAFADQRRFLLTTTRAKRPDMQSPQTFNDLLKDLQQDMGSVGDIRDSHRGSSMKEHLAMVGEGIGALQWLLMEGRPADYVAEVIGGAQMYGNRVLKANKEGDQAHVKYVQAYYALLKALQDYIKKHYPSGVTWNANGIDAAQAYRDADTTAPTTNGAASTAIPPSAGDAPPPPPPLPNFDNAPPAPPPPPTGAAQSGDMGAIFSQLNRGEAITSSLKKVDKSQMTHKNPSLRASSTVTDTTGRSKSPGPDIKPKPPSMRQNSVASNKKTTTGGGAVEGKKELEGNKWLISHWDSPPHPLELDVTLSQSILITQCINTTIILRGKANALSIDNSPRTQLLVDSLVSSIDVIKSANVAVQVTGALPTILLDQVDGATIYLGKQSLSTEVFTSKCSGINIVLPPEKEEDDGRECALPEQMRTFVREGKLVSEIVEHAG